MTDISGDRMLAIRVSSVNAVQLPADAKVTFMIGVKGKCFPTSREAINANVEKALLALADFGVELEVIVTRIAEDAEE